MYSIRKSDDIRRRTNKNRRVVLPKRDILKYGNKTHNTQYKNQRILKESYYEEEYDDKKTICIGRRVQLYNDGMDLYIDNNDINGIKSELSKGYKPDFSFGQNCYCCCYEDPDDLTRCFWKGRLEAFKILFPLTNPELIIRSDDDVQHGVQISGEGAEPYLRIMSETIDIPSDYLMGYIGYDRSFNVKTLHALLDAIGKTEDSLDFKNIRLARYNKDYVESLLKTGKMDLEWMMSSVIRDLSYNGRYDQDLLVSIGQLCIYLGMDTSMKVKLGVRYWKIAKNLSLTINTSSFNEMCIISLDKFMVLVTQYLSEDHQESTSIKRMEIMRDSHTIKHMECLRDIYIGGKHDHAVTIQCLYRVFRSKGVAHYLRLLPENLFDPAFTLMRKKLLKIDTSSFN